MNPRNPDWVQRARTLAAQSFMAINALGASAAAYSMIQLWNPSSTKRALVYAVRASSQSQGSINLSLDASGIASDSTAGVNKLAGGAASACHTRIQQTGATSGGSQIELQEVLARSPALWQFARPIILPPSTGLTVWHGTVNVTLNASFEFDEELI